LIQEFVADLDFSPIRPVGDKSFSVALDLAWCRFGMPAVLRVHNVHGGETSWGRRARQQRGDTGADSRSSGTVAGRGSEPGQGILSPREGPVLGLGSRPRGRIGRGQAGPVIGF
jgi:hypothetical protein